MSRSFISNFHSFNGEPQATLSATAADAYGYAFNKLFQHQGFHHGEEEAQAQGHQKG
jgi:hypothetical protein